LPPLLIDDIPDLIANISDFLEALGQRLELAYSCCPIAIGAP
jgi:hypothetical protein